MTYSPNGRLLALYHPSSWYGDKAPVRVFEVATGKQVAVIEVKDIDHLTFAVDNRCIITNDEGFLRIWDLATGQRTALLGPAHQGHFLGRWDIRLRVYVPG